MAALTNAQLYALTQKHFGDLGPEVVDTMYQIALRESGGNPDAYNGVGQDNSHGLWQINTIAGANPDMLKYNLSDPEQNAQAAREIYDRAGPQAWSTYDGGGGMPDGPTNALTAEQADAFLNEVFSSRPKPGDYHDDPKYGSAQDQYDFAYGEWQQHVITAQEISKNQHELESGIMRLDDGTVITQAQFDQLDPMAQSQVTAQMANKNLANQKAWNDEMNTLGLSQFQVGNAAREQENQRTSQDFQNNLSRFGAEMSLGEGNQNTAVKQVDRQLAGMQESRARADQIMQTLLKAAPWMVPDGKTNFSPGDLGGAVSKIAQFGGIGPTDSLMNFTGTMAVDPRGELAAQDAALGVTGQLPQIPGLGIDASQIPQAPASMAINTNMPSYRLPAQPVTVNVPQMPPPPPVSIGAAVANSKTPEQVAQEALTVDLMKRLMASGGLR